MAVVREFALPDLGEGLTEAEIVRWLVEVGEVVAVDQPVVEVETAKAVVEVPCPYAGVVTARFGAEGTELPVGAALLTVAVGAESPAGAGAAPGGGPDAPPGAPPGAAAPEAADTGRTAPAGPADRSGNVLVGYGTGAPPARRRRVRPSGIGGRGTGGADGPGRSVPRRPDGRPAVPYQDGVRDVPGGGGPARPGPAGAGFREPGVEIAPGGGPAPGRPPAPVPAAAPEGAPEGAPSTGPAAADGGHGGVGPGGGTAAPARRARPGAPGADTAPETGGGAGARPAATSAGGTTGQTTGQAAAQATAGTAAEIPVEAAAETRGAGPVAVVSPLVRRLAREHGLDLRRLAGSGPDGLILRRDVEDALRRAAVAEPAAPPAPGPAGPPGTGPDPRTGLGPVITAAPPSASGAVAPSVPGGPAGPGLRSERIPLRGVRGAVAEKLSRSRREIPDATTWVDVDATELLAARAAMNAGGRPKVSLLALLARICTAALGEFPELNSTVDTAAREVVRLPAVHLGFAAQTDRGLMVPVVRDAHTLGASALSAEFARLTEAARAGRLTPAELTGSTFTLNNYGVFGVDGSTPIINHPEAAMLGVGRIVPKPWVHQGELAVRQVTQLSFTFDHRVCDGGTAGGFLRHVADRVEQPALLLRTL
ncbi:dihydrolipoamide acetyltransferase family protein [Streptomyces zingiberis]|uniref:dihydrolipoamide acetyltransferase family protein n=1 Tax=Streptomyces zingiberis TaxID=2053010 RepID=UPI001F0F8DDE|nr:dihydrolipoamide acetyltransferase family protein [Streptomyces zingiberis]